MVRLEGVKDLADDYVRVRLWQIESSDLNLFQFDFDVTMMIFFLNADEQIYARFGGRGPDDAEIRMTLAGLRYTMKSVLDTHKSNGPIASPAKKKPLRIRELSAARNARGCIHCHQVNEMLMAESKRAGTWTRDSYWRYPLPGNLGFQLEIDRGNIVASVDPKSAADQVGLKSGDKVNTIGDVPIHSFGDAQFALDKAPKSGSLRIAWERQNQTQSGELKLQNGWRQTDLTWRPSLRHSLPSARIIGRDLNERERAELGLSKKQLAFQTGFPISSQAKAIGIREGDIVLGVDNKKLEMKAFDFLSYVRRNYLIGDQVTINVLRNGKRINLPMTLR